MADGVPFLPFLLCLLSSALTFIVFFFHISFSQTRETQALAFHIPIVSFKPLASAVTACFNFPPLADSLEMIGQLQ